MIDRIEGGLRVQGVKDGFNQEYVHPAVHQAPNLLGIRLHQFCEIHRPITGVVHIRTDTRCLVGWTDGTGHKPWLVGVQGRYQISLFLCQTSRGDVEFVTQFFHAVVSHGNALGIEGIGLENIGSSLQIIPVDLANDIRPR